MSVHILGIALLVTVCLAVVVAFRVNLLGEPKTQTPPSQTIVSSAQAERIVVMPTTGGRLEVVTVRVRETFTRSDSRVLFDFLDLGTTVSKVRVDATYRAKRRANVRRGRRRGDSAPSPVAAASVLTLARTMHPDLRKPPPCIR